jgi:hypothetical protein
VPNKFFLNLAVLLLGVSLSAFFYLLESDLVISFELLQSTIFVVEFGRSIFRTS